MTRVALVQLCVSDDPATNLSETVRLIKEAIAEGASLIATPEVTNAIIPDFERQKQVLQTQDQDQTLAACVDLARENRVTILIGSLALWSDRGEDKFVNRSFLIAPDGSITAQYDKIHMFDVDIDAAETYRESDRYQAGERAVVAEAEIARIGMAICYDMRFASHAVALAKAGAEILTYPSAFSRVTGAAHWEVLLRARAIETGCWVIAPAQTGKHAAQGTLQRQTWGHSLVVDPWGHVVLDAGESPGVYVCDLELEKVRDARRRIPSLRHGRKFAGPE